jgi:hypothetical protein
MQKTSFQATDATTKSSNQEDNERKNFFFFYFIAKHATRKNDDKIKTKRMKENSGLKRRSQTESEHENAKAIKKTLIPTLA